MSQINVNTIGARTGTTISVASGHTLIGAGALIKLASTTASSDSAITFDNVFTSTYKNYKIYINSLTPSASAFINMKFRTGGASGSDLTGTYGKGYWLYKPKAASGSSSYGVGSDDEFTDYLRISGNDIGSGEFINGEMTIYDPLSTNSLKTFAGNNIYERNGNSDIESIGFYGAIDSTTAVTGITIYPSSGNFTSGTIQVLGIQA